MAGNAHFSGFFTVNAAIHLLDATQREPVRDATWKPLQLALPLDVSPLCPH